MAEQGELEQVEPDDGDGFHFAETDPSHRFGRFDHVLGRGAFKNVYKAFDTQEGTEVAWNQVRVSELMSCKDADNKEERDRLFAEIRVLKALKHKNIMSFYDSWYDPRTYTVNFITELFTSGTLRQYRKRHKHIDEEVLKRWAWQILCGLVYLHGHSPPIIHRDLKCDNIFINGSDGVVKIGDLGLATMLRSRTAPQSVLGTPEFMAPELYEEEYDDRVDVYSFGMCLLELSTMEYPYAECKNAAQIYRKVSLGVRPAGLQKVASPELAEFINLCISPRETRPRARQLLKHPYFDSIRKDKLLTSRSDAALAAHAAGESVSDYGSLASGPVSRTASSLNDFISNLSSSGHAVLSSATAGSSVGSVALPGPLSGAGASLPLHPLSRTVSTTATDAHSERGTSDSASVRSQRSNASELAQAVLEHIAEEPEDGAVREEGEGSRPASPPVRSMQASAHASPNASPRPAASPTKLGSPSSGSDSECGRCESTERRFFVRGDWLDGDKRIQLRLRICEPTGGSRTVEFEFDVAVDTAADVAGEMVADLELTPDDAAVIAAIIKSELDRLSELPQINPAASLSLAKAAQVFEASLTTNALEQAHSGGNPRELGLGSREPSLMPRGLLMSREGSLLMSAPSRQLGRFSEQLSLTLPTAASGDHITAALAAAAALATPASTPPSLPTLVEGCTSRRASLDGEEQLPPAPQQQQQAQAPTPTMPPAPPLRPSGGSACSLLSASSNSSIPSLLPSASAPPSQLAAAAPNLARTSPPERPASLPSPGVEPRLPLRPTSPLGQRAAASAVAPSAVVAAGDYPSPSQRVVRSNSVDAMALLSRTSSNLLPPGREPAASPHGASSGTQSPALLSPATSVQEKRIALSQVLEVMKEESGQGSLSAAFEGAAPHFENGGTGLGGGSLAMHSMPLPPLPHAAGGRASAPGSTYDGPSPPAGNTEAASSAALGMMRPRSEACLSQLAPRLGRMSPVMAALLAGCGSAPQAHGGLVAYLSDPAVSALSPVSASSNVSPRSSATEAAAVVAAANEAITRLDLNHQAAAGAPVVGMTPAAVMAAAPTLPPAAARVAVHALSAPASKVPSRDSSPSKEREGSLSPCRLGLADAAAHVNGKRPPIRDKEALRRQAADAMKAVELRSLNLLEGGLGACKAGAARGVPMAAGKSLPGLSFGVLPAGTSIPAVQAPQPQQMQQQQQGVTSNGAPMAGQALPSGLHHPQPQLAAPSIQVPSRPLTPNVSMSHVPLVPPPSSTS